MIAAVSYGEGEPTRRGRERGRWKPSSRRRAAPDENDDQGGASQQGLINSSKSQQDLIFAYSAQSTCGENFF